MPARSGAEYLAGLADQREIWFDGDRVGSVVGHPILGRMARTLAAFYDLQRDAALQAKLTYPSPTTGRLVSLAFIQPRSIEELVRRRVMFKHWADFSGACSVERRTISMPCLPVALHPNLTSLKMDRNTPAALSPTMSSAASAIFAPPTHLSIRRSIARVANRNRPIPLCRSKSSAKAPEDWL